MLAKKQRLTKKEFDRVFAQGKRSHSPTLQLIYLPDSNFRAAVVCGKKVFPKAVDRNLLRRRMYALLAQYHKHHNITGAYIVICKPSIRDVSKRDLLATTLKLLEKVQAST